MLGIASKRDNVFLSRLIETIRPEINRFHGWKLNLSLALSYVSR